MAQHDYIISNQSGAAFRSDLNNALAAIVSQNSGASAPSTTYAYQFWADTTTGLLKIRNAANSAWIALRELDGTLTIEDGTAAAPGLAFESDINTGLYRVGADQLGISTGGTVRAVVDSSGRLGIGTTSPGTTLDVNGGCQIAGSASGYSGGEVRLGATTADLQHSISTQSTGTPFMFFDHRGTSNTGIFAWRVGTGGASERMRIDSSGRLLVGTSTATNNTRLNSKLAVVNAGDGTYGNFSITNYGGAAADRAFVIDINRSRGTTDGSMTSVSSGDILGYLVFRGADGTNFTEAALIKAEVDGTPGTNDMPGRLIFSTTADGASTPTERMRIRNGGSVAIQGVYDNTTASAANVWTDTDGTLKRSTSSIKYKTDVETIQNAYSDALLQCRPVWYRSTCEGDNPAWGWWGFIAEEVAEIDPRLVSWKTAETSYDKKGNAVSNPCTPEPEGVQYDRFVPHLLNLIKRQQQAIETLEARVAALEVQ